MARPGGGARGREVVHAARSGEEPDPRAVHGRVDHLADGVHPALPVGAPRDLDDEVERRGELVAHGGERQVEPGGERP